MIDRFVTTIYCDDVREEVGGKRSFMGVYSGQLIVQSAPATLPKLCVIVIISTPVERPLTKCIIRILKDDDTLAEMPIDSAVLADMQKTLAAQRTPPGLEYHSIMLHAVAQFVPFPIIHEHILRIRIQTEDEELKGQALEIKLGQPTVPTSNPSPAA